MSLFRPSAALLTLFLSLSSGGPALAAPKSKLADPLFEGSKALAKVSPHLLRARSLKRRGGSLAQARAKDRLLHLADGGLEVEIRFTDLTPEATGMVTSLANAVRGIYPKFGRIVGSFDPEVLDELASVPGVRTIHPAYRPHKRSGTTTSQADASIRSSLARSSFDIDGSGVQVGVLSDTFHELVGGTVTGTGCSRTLSGSYPQLNGDLPASITMLENGLGGGVDEGAGMAELIHDLAPGADILFHSAWNGEADFAEGIAELRACGADVIVDDIGYFAEPMFQDGIIAQAAQAAVESGAAFFSAAGNDGSRGIDRNYADSITADDTVFPATGVDFHDFGGGDRFASVTVPPGCEATFVLQWNEPFDGTLGAGAASDLDLYVCESTSPASCAPAGAEAQGCSFGPSTRQGDPLEIVSIDNSDGSAPLSGHLAVEHSCGTESVRFRVAVLSRCDELVLEPAIFKDATIYGHPAAAGVAATGAVFYAEIDSGGVVLPPASVIDTEAFTSRGGRLPIYFSGSGAPLAGSPVLRSKPEIAAPDGANTSFFGSFDWESDGFPNFFGTSAAAPHAAAVAALMLHANPGLPPADLIRRMRRSAIDVASTGRDVLAGDGLVDAFNAVNAALEISPAAAAVMDFDGDLATDLAVFRPSSGRWYVDHDRNGSIDLSVLFGVGGDIPVPADYDGDGKTDIAVFRPSSGRWYVDHDRNGSIDLSVLFGVRTDVPLPADYDGDGKADIAVFRPSTGRWYVDVDRNGSIDHTELFGLNGDVPVPADYDSDGRADIGVFRPSNGRWYLDFGNNGNVDAAIAFGLAGDLPLPGDYNDDGAIDLTVLRRSSGRWYVDTNRNGSVDLSAPYALSSDVAVPGDYDGDYAVDFAVFRPSNGTWFVDFDANSTTNLSRAFGVATDIPLRNLGWVENAFGRR